MNRTTKVKTCVLPLAKSFGHSGAHFSKSETTEKTPVFELNVPKRFVFSLKIEDGNLYLSILLC